MEDMARLNSEGRKIADLLGNGVKYVGPQMDDIENIFMFYVFNEAKKT